MSKINTEMPDKADVSKIDNKFNKIQSDLGRVVMELTAEFGQGAQQVVVSESLIASAYDKYIGVIDSVVGKLSSKVSGVVKKLSGDIIDLDADIKVASARAYAAKAKEELGSTESSKEVPVDGADAGDDAENNEQESQESQASQASQASQGAQDFMPHAKEETDEEHAQHQAQESPEAQAAEHAFGDNEGGQSQEQHGGFGQMQMMPGAEETQPVQEPVHEPVQEQTPQPAQPAGFGGSMKNFEPAQEGSTEGETESSEEEEFYTNESLSKLSDVELAKEYSNIFSISESDALVGILGGKQQFIDELLHEYDIVMRAKK
jgi:hypothetical protein